MLHPWSIWKTKMWTVIEKVEMQTGAVCALTLSTYYECIAKKKKLGVILHFKSFVPHSCSSLIVVAHLNSSNIINLVTQKQDLLQSAVGWAQAFLHFQLTACSIRKKCYVALNLQTSSCCAEMHFITTINAVHVGNNQHCGWNYKWAFLILVQLII